MKTNLQMIATAFSHFQQKDYSACEKTLNRIKNNFSLEDDEFQLFIVAEITQPKKDLAEKLINEGKSYLVGDAQYLVNRDYLKKSLKILIRFKTTEPYFTEEADEEDKIEINYYCEGAIYFDEEGINCISANGGKSASHLRKEIKKIVEDWLSSEFGKVEHW